MGAKQYLREIRVLEIRIQQKKEEIDRLKEEAACVPALEIKADLVQTSPDGQGFTRLIDKAEALERELSQDIQTLQTERHKRAAEIQSLDDPEHVQLLFMFYVTSRPMRYIADYLGIGIRQAYNIHGRALQAFEKKFPGKFTDCTRLHK